MNGQMVFKGMAADVITENIFYCEDSNSVFLSTDKTFTSPISGKETTIIGWVEKSDVNKASEVDKILDSFKKSRALPETQQIAKQANTEGGNEVSENTEVTTPAEDAVVETPAVEETVVVEEAPAEDAVADASADTVEKAADVSEVMVDEPDFAKMLGELKGFFSETLDKASTANAAQVSKVAETVDSFSKSVDARISEMAEQYSTLTKAVEDIKGTMDSVQKRVDAVESETAIKKSTDLGGSAEVTIKKSKWNGSFLGSVSDLIK
jgi:flagellin-like hook-associated protein FlgL